MKRTSKPWVDCVHFSFFWIVVSSNVRPRARCAIGFRGALFFFFAGDLFFRKSLAARPPLENPENNLTLASPRLSPLPPHPRAAGARRTNEAECAGGRSQGRRGSKEREDAHSGDNCDPHGGAAPADGDVRPAVAFEAPTGEEGLKEGIKEISEGRRGGVREN